MPLIFEFKFDKIKTYINKVPGEANIIFEYQFQISFIENRGGFKELIYDELKAVTSINMETASDIMYIDILTHKLDIDPRYG